MYATSLDGTTVSGRMWRTVTAASYHAAMLTARAKACAEVAEKSVGQRIRRMSVSTLPAPVRDLRGARRMD